MKASRNNKEEQETILRFDQADRRIFCCTTSVSIMRRWTRLGWNPTVLFCTREGKPSAWECVVPVKSITFRRLVNGMPGKRGRKPAGVAV